MAKQSAAGITAGSTICRRSAAGTTVGGAIAEEEPPSGGVLIRRPQAGSFWRFGAAMLYKRLFCFDDAYSG
ncbi:hypothetical protein [Murdochiella massiliensis]|uniref:hypothetical protein n=1 Tax=Murdochiella massiliensis TaxID=1673723 RepID=UPI0011DC7C43|nr:hypothetical protein [Murdochiella massiliensis]